MEETGSRGKTPSAQNHVGGSEQMTFGEWVFMIMFWSAMCALFVIHVGKHIHTPGMLWIWQKLWYTDHVRVQLLSYNNKIYHCLGKPCADGSCEGYLYLGSNQGKLKLCASGIVDPECECAFLYVWRHMDHDLRVAQRLPYRPVFGLNDTSVQRRQCPD